MSWEEYSIVRDGNNVHGGLDRPFGAVVEGIPFPEINFGTTISPLLV